MTKTFLESIGCAIEPVCCECKKSESTIQYDFGSGYGYQPFCTSCAESFALGMLRDVEEVRHGKAKADSWYHVILKMREL